MVSDDDIVRALDGTSVSEATNADAINRAINGQPSMTQEAADRAILRSLGSEADNLMGAGIPQDDDYLAQMGMEVAKGRLREQLMKVDPKLTAGAAEMRVEVAAEAAYLAAETRRYEADRLTSVTAALEAQAKETKPNAGAREVTTYTTLDGKETATFVRFGGKSTKL